MLSVIFATVAFADHPVKLILNGKEIAFDVIINGRTLVPVRSIAEALGAHVEWDEQNNIVRMNKKDTAFKIVASIPEANATLHAVKEKNGLYDGFILQINDNREYFNRKNVINPTYAPQLLFQDINRDGQNKLIVILTTGTGTGVHVNEAHVLDPKTLAETEIENPIPIIRKAVKTKVTAAGVEIKSICWCANFSDRFYRTNRYLLHVQG